MNDLVDLAACFSFAVLAMVGAARVMQSIESAVERYEEDKRRRDKKP